MRILVLNGPNLNLIGTREPEIYGHMCYADIVAAIEEHGKALGVAVEVRQSNHEGVLVDWIQQATGTFDAIALNPAAYTHTSIAIRDALQAVQLPTIEVHLSDPDAREAFRHTSYIRSVCIATVKGKGHRGYLEAIDQLAAHLRKGNALF